MQSGFISSQMVNLNNGAVTVKRKLSVRETGKVIRKSHLKKKSGLASPPHMLQIKGQNISCLKKNGG